MTPSAYAPYEVSGGSTLQEQIIAFGRRIEALVERLRASGYVFNNPDEVFPGPAPDAADSIRQIEAGVGPLPLALKLFWLHVGSVDLTGSHPSWTESGYPDPLVVFPPTYAVHELLEYMGDREERDKCNYPYVVPVAPDYFHKADVSGGEPYAIAVPAVADDPQMLNTPVRETFLQHIESALDSGGFPGLAECPGHTWPIESLRGAEG